MAGRAVFEFALSVNELLVRRAASSIAGLAVELVAFRAGNSLALVAVNDMELRALDREALSVLEQVAGGAAGSFALVILQSVELRAASRDTFALLVLLFSGRALSGEAFSVNKSESGRARGLLADAVLELLAGRAASSDTLGFVVLVVSRALNLEAATVLKFESISAAGSGADTSLLIKSMVGFAANSDALAIDFLVVNFTLADAGVTSLLEASSTLDGLGDRNALGTFELETLSASNLVALFTVLDGTGRTSLEDALAGSLIKMESSRALVSNAGILDELEAISALGGLEALSVSFDGILRAFRLALSVDELLASIALDSEALAILELLVLRAGGSGALAVLELVESRAASSDANTLGHSMELFAGLNTLVFSLDEANRAGLDVALAVNELVVVSRALDSDALFAFELEVLRAGGSLANTVDVLVEGRALNLGALISNLGLSSRAANKDAFLAVGLEARLAADDSAGAVGVLYRAFSAFTDLEANTILEDVASGAGGSDAETLFISNEVLSAVSLDAFAVGPEHGAGIALVLEALAILEGETSTAANSSALLGGFIKLEAVLVGAAESDALSFLVVFESFLAFGEASFTNKLGASRASNSVADT